jgi:hypothetical protein
MSADVLLRALRNKRIAEKMPCMGLGFPGPEPAIELPLKAVLVDRAEGHLRLLMPMDEFIKLVASVLEEGANGSRNPQG